MIAKKLQSLYIFLFLVFYVTSSFSAQNEFYNFSHLTVEDGLSQSTVFCILQDYQGYMWFGTTDGLNKFDGYKFTVYNNNPLDSSSLSGNSITALFEDSENNLWIGTKEGVLNKYNRSTDAFSHHRIYIRTKGLTVLDRSYYEYPLVFSRNNNNTITSIIEDSDSTLWIGTWGNGLIHFNKKNGAIIHYFNIADDPFSLSSNRITALSRDLENNIWVGTFGGGLNRMIKSQDTSDAHYVSFLEFKYDLLNSNSLSDDKIISLFSDNNNNVWVGCFTGGLNRIKTSINSDGEETFTIDRFKNEPDNKASLSANMVTSIIEDEIGNIWVGTFGYGLNLYNPQKNLFKTFRNNPFDKNSVADNDVLSLYPDKSGILWIGTHLGSGISKLTTRANKFGLISRKTNSANSLNDEIVWSIYEDSDSVLWIGTYKGGLNKFDQSDNLFSAFMNNPDDKNSISSNHVRSIIEDKYGNLWIGTYDGGLNLFNKTSNNFRKIQIDSPLINSSRTEQIQSIYIDEQDICWLGTFGNGLIKFDLNNFYESNTFDFTYYVADVNNAESISDNRVYTIIPGEDNLLWIGTFGGGLNKFDKTSDTFISYRVENDGVSSNANEILALYIDSDNTIWVGTNGAGLSNFNPITEQFERLNSNKGFDVQVIYGIVEDDNKNLWISSDNGILKYSLINKNVIYYDLRDGLQSMEFSGGAYFKNKSGLIYFGGISGINYFKPSNIKSNDHVPPIVITEFKIFNDVIKGQHEKIEVSYDQNFFTIEISALDYNDPSNNQYAYYMEGLESDWNYSDAALRKALYTNLAPGSYIFRAKGSNSDGVWNNEGISLPVEILPPFWKTWWFILISIILIGSLVSFLISMKVKHLLAIEKLKVRLAADLHDNVGAGLTEISILSELTAHEINDTSKSAAHKLKNISDTARHLVDSMSDIVWFVNPKRDSLHDIIVRLKDSYSDLLSELGVSFKTSNIDSIRNVKIPMDIRQNLFLIFKEGINNSIKHSNCKKINLEAQLEGSNFRMVLTDDGDGIPANPKSTGNGLRNMKERAVSMGGELQISSLQNSGTVIKFIGKLDRPNMLNFLWS